MKTMIGLGNIRDATDIINGLECTNDCVRDMWLTIASLRLAMPRTQVKHLMLFIQFDHGCKMRNR